MSPGPDRVGLTDALAALQDAVDAVAARDGLAHVVVPGGRSPARLFAALSARGLPDATWRLHLADERCVPWTDPRRNGPAVARALGLPADHPAWPTSPPPLADDVEAARRHAARLAIVPDFAAVVLGLGVDGHVASIFPGDPAPLAADAPDALLVAAPGADPIRRITMSAQRLARTGLLLLVVDGDGKDAAVAALGSDRRSPADAIAGPRRLLVDLRR